MIRKIWNFAYKTPLLEEARRLMGKILFWYRLVGGPFRRYGIYSRNLRYYELWGAPTFNVVMIQTTSICNRKCGFCLYGIEKRVKAILLDDDTFKSIIDQLAAINYSSRISLFEINEPFSDKKLLQRIDYATEKLPNAFHHLMTNGDLATEEKLLHISNKLDRLDFNSYDQEALERNMKFIKMLKANKVKAGIVHRNHTIRTNYDSRGGNITKYLKAIKPNRPFCELSHQVLMIKPNGEALGCWHDFYHVNKFGNVKDTPLLEIWFSKEFAEFRKKLSGGDDSFSPLCSKCDYSGYGGWTYSKTFQEDGEIKVVGDEPSFRYPKIEQHNWIFNQMQKHDDKLIQG